MRVLKPTEKKEVWYPLTGQNQSLKLKNQSLWSSRTMKFSMKSVNSNLQAGCDFRQLAPTSQDCKLTQKSEQNLCSVFQPFMFLEYLF